MSTLQDVLMRTRIELREVTKARSWTDDQLYSYINDFIQEIAGIAGQMPRCGLFTWADDIVVPTNTESIDLLDPATGLTYEFAAVKRLYHVPTQGSYIPVEGAPVGEEEMFRRQTIVNSDSAPTYFLRHPASTVTRRSRTLHLLPLANGPRNLRLVYRYYPKTMIPADVIPFPAVYDSMLALGAARAGFRANGIADDVVTGGLAEKVSGFLNEHSATQGEDATYGGRDDMGSYLFD